MSREIQLNGDTYRKVENQSSRKIVRTRSAGVFFANVEKEDGDKFTLTNSRRLWFWAGAASLSQLAESGTSHPGKCKFPEPMSSHDVFGVIEVIEVSEVAAKSIDGVPVWKQ